MGTFEDSYLFYINIDMITALSPLVDLDSSLALEDRSE